MVTFYGAGQATATMNVETKLAKILGKRDNTLVLKAAERNQVLGDISARAAKIERWDPLQAEELMGLRKQVKDVFDKGLVVGDEMMEELWFLSPDTRDVVEKMTRAYNDVVTPGDFAAIGKLMSEHMSERVPILGSFTKYFGRLAQDFMLTAKPKQSEFDWKLWLKKEAFGEYNKGQRVNPLLGWVLGLDPRTSIREKVLQRVPGYKPGGTISDVLFGVQDGGFRPTGKKFGFKIQVGDVYADFDLAKFGMPNKQPKTWTHIPWVNFDGKVLEQSYMQRFEERLNYKDANGDWITNIIQVDQKTEPTWFEQLMNKDGKINDIADTISARTAYAVNGNHSNDATIVKNFHLWGKENGIGTSTIHDAFFTNAARMLEGKLALRKMFANALESNSVKKTLDLLKERGLPQELYDKYLNEAIDSGIIPVLGRSKIGGRVITEEDILNRSDILQELPREFWKNDKSFYGIS